MKVKFIGNVDTLALEKGKVYEVMSIEKGWYRVMTELDVIICSRLNCLK